MASANPDFPRFYCHFCYADITDQNYMKCNMHTCTNPFYHNACLGAVLPRNIRIRICPKCTFELNFGLNLRNDVYNWRHANPHKEFKVVWAVQTMSHELNGNAAVMSGTSSTTTKSALSGEIGSLRMEIAELNMRFESLRTNLTPTRTSTDDVFSPDERTIDVNEREMQVYHSEITALKNQMALYDESLQNQLQLIGIPEREHEDLFGMVELACRKMNIGYHEDDLDWAARMGDKPYESDLGASRPVVVRFVEKIKRDIFLRAGKAARNLTTTDLHVNCLPRRVQVKERWSRGIRCLYQEALFRTKQMGYKFCWMTEDSVFVRKSERYPVVRLFCQSELNDGPPGDNQTPERDVTGNEAAASSSA